MKKILMAALCALGFVGSAWADEGKVSYFAAAEYWTAGGAYDDVEGLLRDSWAPPATAAVSSDISGALGIRAGFFVQTPLDGLKVGGSVGYVLGPKGKFHSFAQTSTPSTWDETYEYENRFIRILPQVRHEIPLSDALAVGLDAGLGLALGKTDADHGCVATGSGVCGSPTDSASVSFSGLTYEVGPSLLYTGARVNLELGITYAGFPSEKATLVNGVSFVPEFKWAPIGVRVGMEF